MAAGVFPLGPNEASVEHLPVARGQDVVDAHRAGLRPVDCRLVGQRVLQGRVSEQPGDGVTASFTARGIKVGIAEENESILGRGADHSGKVVRPEGCFIVVAPAVAVFGAVENGRGGVVGQQGDWAVGKLDGQGLLDDRRCVA